MFLRKHFRIVDSRPEGRSHPKWPLRKTGRTSFTDKHVHSIALAVPKHEVHLLESERRPMVAKMYSKSARNKNQVKGMLKVTEVLTSEGKIYIQRFSGNICKCQRVKVLLMLQVQKGTGTFQKQFGNTSSKAGDRNARNVIVHGWIITIPHSYPFPSFKWFHNADNVKALAYVENYRAATKEK